jgi:hypothetical protein
MRMSWNHTLSPLLNGWSSEDTPGAVFMPFVNRSVNVSLILSSDSASHPAPMERRCLLRGVLSRAPKSSSSSSRSAQRTMLLPTSYIEHTLNLAAGRAAKRVHCVAAPNLLANQYGMDRAREKGP